MPDFCRGTFRAQMRQSTRICPGVMVQSFCSIILVQSFASSDTASDPDCRGTQNRHAPPPGLAFGEPDDRLRRGIQYAAAYRFNQRSEAIHLSVQEVTMDCFASLAMTVDAVWPSRGAMRPRLDRSSRPMRAQGRPGARCTRGLVCNVHEEVRTRAYRSSGEHPAFPAQWFDGLWRALPGDEFLLPPSLPD
jgi:hypothetical protein